MADQKITHKEPLNVEEKKKKPADRKQIKGANERSAESRYRNSFVTCAAAPRCPRITRHSVATNSQRLLGTELQRLLLGLLLLP